MHVDPIVYKWTNFPLRFSRLSNILTLFLIMIFNSRSNYTISLLRYTLLLTHYLTLGSASYEYLSCVLRERYIIWSTETVSSTVQLKSGILMKPQDLLRTNKPVLPNWGLPHVWLGHLSFSVPKFLFSTVEGTTLRCVHYCHSFPKCFRSQRCFPFQPNCQLPPLEATAEVNIR